MREVLAANRGPGEETGHEYLYRVAYQAGGLGILRSDQDSRKGDLGRHHIGRRGWGHDRRL